MRQKPFQRPITPNERLYIVGDRITQSFTLQLVLEMDSAIDTAALNQAIYQANQVNSGADLRAKLGLINSYWYQPSSMQTETHYLRTYELEWDGTDIQTPAFFQEYRFHPEKPTTQVIYLKGRRHFLIFRAFHGVMDAMGLYHWVQDVFRAWNKQALLGSHAALTDFDFLKQQKTNTYRPWIPFDCIAPTSPSGSDHTHYLHYKITLLGKVTALNAKLCHILLNASVHLGAEKARFMIPVDLRSHLSNGNITSNFANPIFVEAPKGVSWQHIYSDIAWQLSNQKELLTSQVDAIIGYVPLSVLKGLVQKIFDKQTKKNRSMISGLVSNMLIDLSELRSSTNKAIEGYFLPINVPIAPITLVTTENKDTTTICFSVSNALATEAQCDELIKQFNGLVEPECVPALKQELPCCDTLWPKYNNTAVAYPQDKTVFKVIWDSIEGHADKTVFISPELQKTSYASLKKRVITIASHFYSLGVGEGARVALLLPGNEEMICSMLACWYLGAAYIPIDIRSPIAWILELLDDAKPVLTVHDKQGELPLHYTGLTTELLPDFVSTDLPKMWSNNLSQLAYIIYTSGSTGRAKGVMINHGQLLNYLFWAKDVYLYPDNPCHTALFTCIAFDLTITTLYLPLLTGGSLTIIQNPITPLVLKAMCTNQKLNFLKLTPSHLRMFSGLALHSNNIITLVVGGEALSTQLAKSIIDKLPAARIFNEYGPTETTVGCMIHLYRPESDITGSVPIGIPSANTRIYCLDEALNPVAIEQEGELYIAGNSVGVGYLNQPELTSQHFLNDPFCPGQRMYQSGDLAKHQADGLLVYITRRDQQAKIRGHRIELSAIENALLTLDGVLQAVVIFNNDALIAYIVSSNELQSVDMRKKLVALVPSYMLPKYFISIPEIPMTINGKVDEKKLPKPTVTLLSSEVDADEDLLLQMRQLFAGALSVQSTEIDAHTTFEELGGDSMQMAHVINEILTKIVKPELHDAFGEALEQLLVDATPYHFYECLSQYALRNKP